MYSKSLHLRDLAVFKLPCRLQVGFCSLQGCLTGIFPATSILCSFTSLRKRIFPREEDLPGHQESPKKFKPAHLLDRA